MHLNDYSIMIKIKCVGHDQSNTTHGLTGCLLFLLSPAHSQCLEVPKTLFFFFFITQLFRFPHEHTVVCQSQNGFYFTWEIFSFLSALFLAGLKWVGLILEKKNGGCCVFSSTNQDLGKRKSDEMTPTHF